MLAAEKIDTTKACKLSKAGNISTLHVAQALNVLRAAGERQEPDVRSPELKQLDAHFPAAKPEDFIIRYGGPGEDVVLTPPLKQFDATARAWMSGAGLPRELGDTLVNPISKVAQHTAAMTQDQLESYGFSEFAKLENAFRATLHEKLVAGGRWYIAAHGHNDGHNEVRWR
jgi:hypothetical protein